MKTIKQLVTILSLFLLTSCGVQWQYTALNHAGHTATYVSLPSDVQVDTITSRWQFERKLRTDFNFRWDYARYMMNQPISFYYMQSTSFRPYTAYNMWWNSTQLWTDWAFNYPYNSWWGMSNMYGGWHANTWNNHWYRYGYSGWYGHDSMMWGWNSPWGQQNYWGHNQWRRNNINYTYINGRRGSTMSIQDKIGQSSMIESSKRMKFNVDNKRKNVYNNNTRPVNNNNNTRPIFNNTKPVINNTKPVINNTRPVINNSRPVFNNSRPVINRSTPTRTNSKPRGNNNTNNRSKN